MLLRAYLTLSDSSNYRDGNLRRCLTPTPVDSYSFNMPQVSTIRINGRALRELREQRGLTVQQLARKIGRHRQSITRLEISNGKPASRVFAYQLVNALETDLSEITLSEDDAEAHGAAA